MNKLAFLEGYTSMSKTALNSKDLVKYAPFLLGAPVLGGLVGGYLGGRAYSALKEPTSGEVANIQAAYVKHKFQQAIEDLDRRKKIERLKEQNAGTAHTLRI